MHAVEKRLVVLTTEWLPWFQETVSGCEKFILVLEVNCVSNLSLNDTLQLTTLRE